MTRDPKPPSHDTESGLDDAALGALVRASTDDWRMPPQRLDQPTWHDRVGAAPRSARRGPMVRVAIPFVTAIVATVLVAFVAVWLTGPTSPNIGKIGPSAAAPAGSPVAPASAGPVATPSPSFGAARGTPLPKRFMPGPPPAPSRVLVIGGPVSAVADLATGNVSPTGIGDHSGSMAVAPGSDGGWVCVCLDWGPMVADHPDGVVVSLEVVKTDGSRSSTVLRSIRGTRDANTPVAAQPELGDANPTADPAHGVVFVGWSRHDATRGWTAGVDVVAIGTASVVSRVELPLANPVLGGAPYVRSAPTVTVSPSGRTVLVSDFWFTMNDQVTGLTGTQSWSGSFVGASIASLRPIGPVVGASCDVADSGPIDDSSFYVLCWASNGGVTLERLGSDGKSIGKTSLSGSEAELDGLTQIARWGDSLYLWQPVGGTLIRFDLRTGEHRKAAARIAAVPPSDPLAGIGRAIGRWLAPTTLAKVLIEPGLVISADGRTAYALGVRGLTGESLGSLGVYVFDTDAMQQTTHWQPTADYVSIAISGDGRFVYVLGQPGSDAAGNVTSDEASLTVFDSSTGGIVAIAGQLGSQWLLFPNAVVR